MSKGDIAFEARNGGVNLKRLGGDVRGKTANGGLKVELGGNTWRGNQLDVQTTNGGIQVTVPEGYSARFRDSTVNGGVTSDIPGANIVSRKTRPQRFRDFRVGRTPGSSRNHQWRHSVRQVLKVVGAV